MPKRFVIVAGILLLAVAGLAPAANVTASSTAGSAAGATPSRTLLTIACPSVTDCYAGGNNGTLLATHDGGATWQSQSWKGGYRTNATSIVSIACAAARDCFALVQAGCEELGAHVPVLHTVDGGSHWVTTTIDACGSSLTCPEITICYTIISPTGPGTPAFVRTTDSGASWRVQTRIDSNSLEGSLACPSPTVCYVAYQNALGRSTDAGKHWSIRRTSTGKPCTPRQNACPGLFALACPGRATCYAGGSEFLNGRPVAVVITTGDGFRSQVSHPVPGIDNVTSLSCPAIGVCFALDGPYGSRVAVTRDAGRSWHVERITSSYPFNTLACPSAGVCYTAGYLGRLTGTKDGGAAWHDQTPALFVSGTYGARQTPHTYSQWFMAGGPWQMAVGKRGVIFGADGRPLPASCGGIDTVAVYVRNAQNQTVAGPIKAPGRADRVSRKTLQVTGKLRLDVASRCSSFSVRIDGVQPSQG